MKTAGLSAERAQALSPSSERPAPATATVGGAREMGGRGWGGQITEMVRSGGSVSVVRRTLSLMLTRPGM